MDLELTHRIAANGGYLFRHELNTIGMSDRVIRRMVEAKLLRRIRQGTYVDFTAFAASSPAERHCITAASVITRLGGRVVASHQTAAALHGIDLYGLDLSEVHVTRLDGHTGRIEAGVAHHEGRAVPESDIVRIGDLGATSPGRTVFEMSGFVPTEGAMVAASSALRLGLTSDAELAEHGRRLEHWKGTQRARLAIRLADGRAETVIEVRSLYAMWVHGIPRPDLQVPILGPRGSHVGRPDFLWELYRHIGEADGAVKYGGIPGGPDARTALISEKRREDLLRALLYGISRWMWSELAAGRVHRWAAELKAALETSRRLYTNNATHIALG